MLKQLLQLLLETFLKAKKEWVGNQSMPSDNTVSFTPVRNEWTIITAPADGYLYVYSENTTGIDILCNSVGFLASSYTQRISRATIPCRKGISVSYLIHTDNSDSVCSVVFTKTIGS